jgi:D-xylose reductase
MHTFPLARGDQLPALGLGLWKVPRGQAADVVVEAVRAGYRHFDSACDYGNEAEVGEGLARVLAEGLCRRDELWVTSKLWNTYHAAPHVRPALLRTLADLKLDYLDLYLLHFPIALRYVPPEVRYPPEWIFDPQAPQPRMEPVAVPLAETWRAMEALVDAGLVRHLGVCNFNCALLRDLLSNARIPPEVLQVELHPLLTQNRLVRFARESGLVVTAFSPLGATSYIPLGMARPEESLLTHPVVTAIAACHRKSAAQVLLRWAVQRGTAAVCKATSPQHLRENLAIFDFELSPQEMHDLAALNRNRRFNDPGEFCEAAFGTFFPIYD